jgi:hypothetical protein
MNRKAGAIGSYPLNASAFVFPAPAPHKIARRISYSKRKVKPLARRLFVRRLRFATAALCLRRDEDGNDD